MKVQFLRCLLYSSIYCYEKIHPTSRLKHVSFHCYSFGVWKLKAKVLFSLNSGASTSWLFFSSKPSGSRPLYNKGKDVTPDVASGLHLVIHLAQSCWRLYLWLLLHPVLGLLYLDVRGLKLKSCYDSVNCYLFAYTHSLVFLLTFS